MFLMYVHLCIYVAIMLPGLEGKRKMSEVANVKSIPIHCANKFHFRTDCCTYYKVTTALTNTCSSANRVSAHSAEYHSPDKTLHQSSIAFFTWWKI